MTAPLKALKPNQVADLIKADRAVLVDIREPDEFARRHVKGAVSRPLATLDPKSLGAGPGKQMVFACRSGMRTQAYAGRLAACVDGQAFVLEGGLDGWAAAGFPMHENPKAPLEVMRQVQIAAGVLVLSGVALGLSVHPAFFGLSAFVGAGLALAGVTGFCGMARVLALLPWNRPAKA